MKREIILAGTDLDRLAALSVALSGKQYDVTIVQGQAPVADVLRLQARPTALLVALNGSENVVDVRTLVSRLNGAAILLLTPDRPPSAALARIVRSAGGAILPANEPDIVIIATLVAMNAHRSDVSVGNA
jgi:hypothetical protein